ncbi:MAG TPA: hypothetical protein VN088_16200 [Nocardioides sp.]|nr:hypothetical protein [Nocardioides sp.]
MRSLLAVPPPRVRVVPEAIEGDGDEAAYLASSYGLTPDPAQRDVVGAWLLRRPDRRWATQTGSVVEPRQNGKNGIIEVRELYGAAVLGERFLHTAHEVKTARKAFLRIAGFFENERQYPELAALVTELRKTNGQEAVLLANGGGVEFVARSRSSGRGFTDDVLVCDEAQDLTDEELAALLPTISAAPLGNPQVLFAGTPPDPARPDRGQVFTRIRREARTSGSASWHEWGVPDGPLPSVDDRRVWRACNPAYGFRITEAEIARERHLMSPEDFARERLGWWGLSDDDVDVFGSGLWRACAVSESAPASIGLVLGAAVSVDRAWSSIAAAGRVGDRVQIGAVDRRRGTQWLPSVLADIAKRRGAPVVVDGRGPAAMFGPELERLGVRVLTAATSDVCDGCARIYDLVQSRRLAHPAHPELDEAVRNATTRHVGDRWAWARRRSEDVSMLEAATLAVWGATMQPTYDVLDSIL